MVLQHLQYYSCSYSLYRTDPPRQSSVYFLDTCFYYSLAIKFTTSSLASYHLVAHLSGAAIFAASIHIFLNWEIVQTVFCEMMDMRKICRTRASSQMHKRVYIRSIERTLIPYGGLRKIFSEHAIPPLKLYLQDTNDRIPAPPSPWGSNHDPFQPVSDARIS